MKIGILTVHNAPNYGALLQCYALQTVLGRLGNNDVEVINYKYFANNEHWSTFPIFDYKSARGIRPKIIIILKFILFFPYRIKKRRKFKEFSEKNLKISKKEYDFKNCSFGSEYDFFVIGSDQLWSKRIFGMEPVYWGNFKRANNAKVLTYAVSAGTVEAYNQNDRDYMQKSLSNFSSLSVREDVLKTYIESLTSKPVMTVLDPTLLLESDFYVAMAKKPKQCPERFVLVYRVGENALIDKMAEVAAEKFSAKIVEIGNAMITHKMRHPHYIQFTPTVEEFMWCFKNALCVFSLSFHGLVFSLKFRKQFYVGVSDIMDRVNNLLDIIDMKDRVISSDTMHKMTFDPICYDSIEQKLKPHIKKSIGFLVNSIGNQDER